MHRKKDWVIIIASMLIISILSILYMRFVSNIIYKESSNHLEEIYEQINNDFRALSEHNWKMLQDWEFYIQNIKDNNEQIIQDNIILKKDKWNFTDFYFLNEDGKYITVDGQDGYIDFSCHLEELMLEKKKIAIDGTHPNGAELAIFAIPVKKAIFKGFSYSAIAISYNNKDLEKVLNVKAFSNKAECFITYPDGRVIISTHDSETKPNNILAMLDNKNALSQMDLIVVKNEIANGKQGTIKYKIDDKKYYMTYIPVGFQNWVLLGVVPQCIVNESMNIMQVTTAIIVALIVLLVLASGFIYYRRINKEKLKEMDVELRYREQLFELLAENSLDMYAMFSTEDYKVEYISPNVENILGISVDDILGKSIEKLRPSHVEETKVDWKDLKALEAGESIHSELGRKNIVTGQKRWYKESVYRGSIEGTDKFLLVMMDCTQDKKLRYQLEQALHIAKVANKAKSNFLSNMSHDIRTPMNAIMGFSQLLRKEINNPNKVSDYINKISIASEHLLGLINDVLDMSRIESGKNTLSNKEFKLESLLEDIKMIVQPLADAKEHKLNICENNICEQTYRGDVTKIKQILINLLSNAIKYTPNRGTINFIISLLDIRNTGYSLIRFEVEDNGIGMSKEYITNIFEPFTREINTTLNNQQGTGLGMAITKNLIELMGGTISVYSDKGKGSRFMVELEFPVVKEDELVIEESAGINSVCITSQDNGDVNDVQNVISNEIGNKDYKNKKRKDIEGLRFLIAEDNDINAEIIKELLDIEGAKCDVVSNGKEAVETFAYSDINYYDVILLDEQMPVMCGTDAAMAIRKCSHPRAKTIKIIAMTANAFAEDVEKSLQAGMNAHLSKPIEIDVVKECVIGVLG